jgi:hypothetical protein
MKLSGPACTEAPRRRAETGKQGDERERKAMQAGSELSGGLGVKFLTVEI